MVGLVAAGRGIRWRCALPAGSLLLLVPACSSKAGSDAEPTVPPSSAPVTEASSTTVPTSLAQVDDDVAAVVAVVESLEPGATAGFAPEIYAQVDDPTSILEAGSRVEPVVGSIDLQGDAASIDVVVYGPDGSETRHWAFLERRAGNWLVVMTMPLPED